LPSLASWRMRDRLHADVRPNARISHSLPRTNYISPFSLETHQTAVTSDILPTTSGDGTSPHTLPDCVHVTGKCPKEGEHWQERFSKGAHQRQSAYHHHRLSPYLGPEFSFGMFLITVDEVSNNRKAWIIRITQIQPVRDFYTSTKYRLFSDMLLDAPPLYIPRTNKWWTRWRRPRRQGL
jgi:hypothetical protein